MKRPTLPVLATCAAVVLMLLAAAHGVRAQSDPDVADGDTSPYHHALLNYKNANYDAARLFIDQAEKAQPASVPVELLKVRILTEQHDYKDARHVLANLNGNPALTPEDGLEITLASGDLALRQHLFSDASKFYESLLTQKPGDPDVTLKLVYARIGAGDLVEAEKDASQLKPLDPVNPAYYFARAALAKVTNDSGAEEQDMEQARTIYGITTTNRYLKTYLEVSATNKNSVSSALNPPPAATSAVPVAPAP